MAQDRSLPSLGSLQCSVRGNLASYRVCLGQEPQRRDLRVDKVPPPRSLDALPVPFLLSAFVATRELALLHTCRVAKNSRAYRSPLDGRRIPQPQTHPAVAPCGARELSQ
jgi:hypothetical protein